MSALHWKVLVPCSTETRLQTELWPPRFCMAVTCPSLTSSQRFPHSPLSNHCPSSSPTFALALACNALPWLPSCLVYFHSSGLFVDVTSLGRSPWPWSWRMSFPYCFLSCYLISRKLIIAYSYLTHLVFTCLPSPPECWVHKGEIVIVIISSCRALA